MKLSKVLLGISLAASTYSVLAAAPVYDVNSNAAVVNTANLNAVNSAAVPSNPRTLSEQLTNLSRKLDARNRAQVNIQRQLDELQTEVNEIRGITELHTHQLGQVLERQRELYQELDRRVSEALKTSTAVPVSLSAPNNNGNVGYSSDLTENDAYDRAINLVLKDKLYEQAIPAFKQFNQKYPQSIYSHSAHYWLGQLLYSKNDLAGAQQEFSIVVNQFKDSSKRADAMLKLAMVAQKQNKNPQAVTLYQQLIKQYPSSTAAQLAKSRLSSLAP